MEGFQAAEAFVGPVARMHPSVSAYFRPRSVAVVGATEKPGISRICITNLLNELPALKAAVYPINPTRKTVFGAPCYPSIAACPTVPDLVVLCTPAKTVPAIVTECVDAKVPAVIVISAGFKETGPEGKAVEDRMYQDLQRGGMKTRIVGPNCFGVMNSFSRLNATFAQQLCLEGSCAFISQSGAMMALVFDEAIMRGRGFSTLASVGSMLDVSWPDLFEYAATDDKTKVVMQYMESIGNARKFMSAARHISLRKPVVLLKSGRTSAAAKAAVSHTGSLTGADDVADAAFARAGVVRVDAIDELLEVSEAMSMMRLPAGPRLAILTHAGGPGVVAADALCMAGGVLADLPAACADRLDPLVPPHWSRGNPLDLTGGTPPEGYAACLDEIANASPAFADGVLVFVGNLAVCPPSAVASIIRRFASRNPHMCVIACFMGGHDVVAARELLVRAGVPVFSKSDVAARAFVRMWEYRKARDLLVAPVPAPAAPVDWPAACDRAHQIDAALEKVRATGRLVLTEAESKEVLRLAGIPVAETVPAHTIDAATAAATRMGFPVVVKLLSETITHKSDVGGVVLDVRSEQGVRAAWEQIRTSMATKLGADWEKHWGGVTVQPMLDINNSVELLLGASADPQFGPVVAFGTGGKFVEVYADRALALPPLDPAAARRAIAGTKVAKALAGARGQGPVDMAQLSSIVCAFGDLVAYHSALIKEADVNPLLASSSRICAVDGRIVLWPADNQQQQHKAVPTAVAPFPLDSVRRSTSSQGCVLRALRPDDEPAFNAYCADAAALAALRAYCPEADKALASPRALAVRLLFEPFDGPEVAMGAFSAAGQLLAMARVVRREFEPQRCTLDAFGSSSSAHGLVDELVQWTQDRAAAYGFANITVAKH
eukprot:m51a1_g369 putative acetyl synthetase subunit alpha (891) ;mRNA; r:625893-629024